ncbi:MAG: DUF721 domain-containing protein [Deltaproteobacteria bacterium]|jgi:hypothetical protein|nr:DUF721 domain-containing protein [Deltaproteobacteria bacterium]
MKDQNDNPHNNKKRAQRFPGVPPSLNTLLQDSMDNGQLYFVFRTKRLYDNFKKIINPEALNHVEPYGYQLGTLYLKVDSSAWLERIRYLKAGWIKALNIEMGKNFIKDIHFKIMPLNEQVKSLPLHPDLKRVDDLISKITSEE